jgi:uncharacterized membrane protein YdfJ with MMPL/SSD domain
MASAVHSVPPRSTRAGRDLDAGQVLGLGAASPVEAFLPVFTLAILFGLSTDYQVFLVSRMQA